MPTSPTSRRPSASVLAGSSSNGLRSTNSSQLPPAGEGRMSSSRRGSRVAAGSAAAAAGSPSIPPGIEALQACYGRKFSYNFYKHVVSVIFVVST